MGLGKKMRNWFQMGKGRTKQHAGRAVGNPRVETKGQAEQAGGAGRQVGERVKDAGRAMRKAAR